MNKPCPQCGAPLPRGTRVEHCPACAVRELLDATPTGEPGPARESSPSQIGRYELLAEVGRGGMGVVFRARQPGLERVVALKMVRDGAWAGPVQRQRFLAEARTAARLRHPNIVAVHEAGEQDGHLWFSMDHVPGPSLAALVGDRPLSADTAAELLIPIAEAVQFAHQQGILHRDLKPQNILLDGAGRPQITDFGLALELGHERELTFSGQLLGTPAFMAPEQAAGRSRDLGPAADVYALGGVLYYLLTARAPFHADSLPELLALVSDADPVPPRQFNRAVPADLETICLKCLRKEAGARYASAADLAEDLGRFLRREPVQARRLSAANRAWRWCRRRPVLAGLGTIAAAAIVAATMFAYTASQRANEARQTAEENRSSRSERLLVDARRMRESGRTGQQTLALSLLQEARALNSRPDFVARLQDETIAATLAPDVVFEPVRWFGETNPVPIPSGSLIFSRDLRLCAQRIGTNVVVRQTSDGRETARLGLRGDGQTMEEKSLVDRVRLSHLSDSGRWLAFDDPKDTRAAMFDMSLTPPKTVFSLRPRCVGFAGFLAGEQWPGFATDEGSLMLYESHPRVSHELGVLSWARRRGAAANQSWYLRRMKLAGDGRRALISVRDSSAGERPLLAIFDLPSDQLVRRMDLEAGVRDLAFSVGGDTVVAVVAEHQTVVLDANTGRSLLRMEETCLQPGVGRSPDSLGLFWQSNRLVEARLIGIRTCREWRHNWEAMNYTFSDGFASGGITLISFSFDGRFLAAEYQPRLGILDLAANQPAGWRSAYRKRNIFHPRQPKMLSLDPVNLTRVDWSLDQDRLNLTTSMTPVEGGLLGRMEFDDAGSVVAVALRDRSVAVLDWSDFKPRARTGVHVGLSQMFLSPDARWLATWSSDRNDLIIWNATTGAKVRSRPQTINAPMSFSPDGRWLAFPTANAYEVEEAESGRPVATFPSRINHPLNERALKFSPDGQWLAMLLGDAEVGLRRTSDWSLMATLPARTPSAFTCLAFSHDSRQLAAGGEGGRICIWNLPNIRATLADLNLPWGTKEAADPWPATNAPPTRVLPPHFPPQVFPIAYPTNAAGVTLPGDYNFRRDFSITRNPSGPWLYGCKAEPAEPMRPFLLPRRDLRDLKNGGLGDYQSFSWCEEIGRPPALSYHAGLQTDRVVATDPGNGKERVHEHAPAHAYFITTTGKLNRESTWTGTRFSPAEAGTYEFRVHVHALAQFARFQENTRAEFLLWHSGTAVQRHELAPDATASFTNILTISTNAPAEFLLRAIPRPGMDQPLVSFDIEVHRR